MQENHTTLAEYIEKCLYSNEGFYTSQNAFGRTGSFVTAPMISSLFGEIIGLFLINILNQNFPGKRVNIIEIGSGNGDLLEDLMQIFAKFPHASKQISFISIDKSKRNIAYQQERFSSFNVSYCEDIFAVDFQQNPCIFISNELLDAYPINQYKYKNNQFEMHKISNKNGVFNSIWSTCDDLTEINKYFKYFPNLVLKNNSIIECSKSCIEDFERVCKVINLNTGGLIYIDYGYITNQFISTIQAIQAHEKVDIFANPGKSDITHLVNFQLFHNIARNFITNSTLSSITTQGKFLVDTGINHLAKKYIANNPHLEVNISQAVNRLINPMQMGDLFKFLLYFKW